MLRDPEPPVQLPAPTAVARRPFAGADEVAIVLPRDGAPLGDDGPRALAEFGELLLREQAELEVELGASVRFVDADPGVGPRFLVGPAACNPDLARQRRERDERAGLRLDRERQLLVVDAPDLDGIGEAFSLLRTLVLDDADEIMVADCRDLDEAIARIVVEVGRTYPSFTLRRLDWPAICARHVGRVRAAVGAGGADDPLPAMQEMLAELQDAHTWVKPRPAPVPLPYALWVEGATATFTRVPPSTAAWEAGVRPGDTLLDVDAAGWWARTSSSPHARPLMSGYRLLSGLVGVPRTLTARSPRGHLRTW